MKRFSKISLDDLNSIQVDSGYLIKELDVDNPIFDSSKIICATTGGINPVCIPEYYDFSEDVDNAKESKETKRIRGWETSISFTTLTASLTMIRYALGAADISGNALTLRQRLNYAKDFKDVWWVGKRADDKVIAIRLIRSLSDSGFSSQTTKKGKGQMSVTLKGHSSFAEKDKIPMEIYVFAESDIPVTPDEPVKPEMYLYGTPSETGNIGLRNGDTVTYYDGVVAANVDGVWTDKDNFPFGYITSTTNDVWLHLMSKQVDMSNNNLSYRGTNERRYLLSNGTWEFEREINNGSGTLGNVTEGTNLVWANTDVLHYGSTEVYHSATEPLYVRGVVDTINGIPIYEVII